MKGQEAPDRYAYRTGARLLRAGGVSEHRKKAIRKMYADGLTQTEIAKSLGISRGSVKRVIQEEER